MEKDMEQVMKKAEVLIEALPYIQKFNRKIIVVKYGGSAMSNEELQKNVIKDVTLLKLVGFKPIIVHGGGKEISRWVGKVGKEAKFVNGLRVTDEETMEIAEMVLNKVNKSLVTMVEELGVKAVGVSGKDGGLLQVEKKYSDGQDIGYGVIGMQIPVDKITAGIKKLVTAKADTLEAGSDAAHAIMTTDTISKEIAIETEIGGKTVTLGGMCKGSGMIHPNMCTMLGFVTTDVNISKEMLQKCVSADVVDSFNMISVDGDTSTNDTLLVLANGMAGNEEITAEGEDYDNFCKALHEITTFLAKKMAGDGEGATALFETKVIHAASKEDARTLAKSVICSSLTKAAIFGHDANWGRILCALGYSGAKFDPENVDLYFESKSGKIHIFGNGVACDYSEEEATKILSDPEVTALVDMHMGDAEATAWGCDLSYDYVKINADYRS